MRTVCLAVGFLTALPAWAFQYEAMSLSVMNVTADVIVIGSLVEQNGPHGLSGSIQIEEVVAGHGVRVGERLEFEIQRKLKITDSPRTSRAIVWLGRSGASFAPINHSDSVRQVDPKTLETIREELAMLRHPMDGLRAKALPAAPLLHAWIQYKWIPSSDKPSGDDRHVVMAYLLHTAKLAPDPERAKALEILGPMAAPEAYPLFVDALSGSSPMVHGPALEGIRRLGDRRAVPVLKDFLAKNPHLRDDVLRVLGTLSDANSVPWLIEQLKEKRTLEAAMALANLGDTRALPALLEYVWQQPEGGEELVLGFQSPVVLEQARERLEDHPAAPAILAAFGDPADAVFMHRHLLQGHRAGLAWARRIASKDVLALVAQAARTTHDRQFLIEALALLGEHPGPRPDEIPAALRLFQSSGYESYGVDFIAVRLGHPASPPDYQDRRAHGLRMLREHPARFGLGAADILQITAWEDPARKPVLAKDLAGVSDEHLAKVFSEPFDDARHAALSVLIERGTPLGREQIEALRHSSLMGYYLHEMEQGKVPADAQLLSTLIAEPWAQTLDDLYRALRKARPAEAKAPLRELLTGCSIDVRLNAAITLAHMGDESGLEVLKSAAARADRSEFKHHSWMSEVQGALALLKQPR